MVFNSLWFLYGLYSGYVWSMYGVSMEMGRMGDLENGRIKLYRKIKHIKSLVWDAYSRSSLGEGDLGTWGMGGLNYIVK